MIFCLAGCPQLGRSMSDPFLLSLVPAGPISSHGSPSCPTNVIVGGSSLIQRRVGLILSSVPTVRSQAQSSSTTASPYQRQGEYPPPMNPNAMGGPAFGSGGPGRPGPGRPGPRPGPGRPGPRPGPGRPGLGRLQFFDTRIGALERAASGTSERAPLLSAKVGMLAEHRTDAVEQEPAADHARCR
jgi:hypothetical protein